MKSQCCNADIEIDKGGIGVFSLTTGAYVCSKCRKYCVKNRECAYWVGSEKRIENDEAFQRKITYSQRSRNYPIISIPII